MGMLKNGYWTDKDEIISSGAYKRPQSGFLIKQKRGELIRLLSEDRLNSEKRFWLIASNSCPWSQRCLIVYHLLGLSNYLNTHIAFGERVEGYALNGGDSWQAAENFSAVHLHELYSSSDPSYTGRVTVPLLWDSHEKKIICNESSEIVEFFDELAISENLIQKFSLFPSHQRAELDQMNGELFSKLSNGVYRAGFAETQEAYEIAVKDVFGMLEELETRLSDSEFLLGSQLSICDINLFTTLVRFDCVYYILHRCSYKKLTDFEALWNYARRLYQLTAFKKTVDFTTIKSASYLNDTNNNPHGIIPVTDEAIWCRPACRK